MSLVFAYVNQPVSAATFTLDHLGKAASFYVYAISRQVRHHNLSLPKARLVIYLAGWAGGHMLIRVITIITSSCSSSSSHISRSSCCYSGNTSRGMKRIDPDIYLENIF